MANHGRPLGGEESGPPPEKEPRRCAEHSAQLLQLDVHQVSRGRMVLAVGGEIDASSAPPLRAEIHRCLRERPAVLVLDLTEVGFLSATGLTLLTEAQQCADPDTQLRLVAAHRAALRPMQIAGVDRLMALFPSRDLAVML